MWETIKQNISIAVSFVALLTGGLAGAIATMIFNHYRRDKFWLGCYVKRRLIIKPKHPNISILYNDQYIERLDLQEIVLKNIGNKVIENITIRIEVTGQIVDKKLEAPDGANFSLEPAPDESHILILNCDYINQKDVITVQITEADSSDTDARVIARAKNLTVKQSEVPTQNEGIDIVFLPIILLTGVGVGVITRYVYQEGDHPYIATIIAITLIAIAFSIIRKKTRANRR